MKKALRKTANIMAGFFTLIVSLFTLTSCQADDAISRDYRCFFIFDTSLHPLPCQLTGILGNTGHFCTIEASHRDGYRQLNTVRNFDGNAETILITTAKENQPGIALGANNRIIVGTSSYDFVLIAYDGQCANCLSNFGGTSYPSPGSRAGSVSTALAVAAATMSTTVSWLLATPAVSSSVIWLLSTALSSVSGINVTIFANIV